MLIRNLAIFSLVLLSVSLVSGTATVAGVPTFDTAVAINNWNQFIKNLDRAQEFLLNIWKGAYGSIGTLWLVWSWWLVLGGFYYSFANTYLKAKDEAEAEWKENMVDTEGRLLNTIDVTSIFKNLKTFQDKATSRIGEACYNRGICEMRSYLSTTSFVKMIPKPLRRLLRIEPQNRSGETCEEMYASCTYQNLLLSLLQGYFPGATG